MKHFLDKDFLLTTETSKLLYHDYVKKMPVIDYHCHLSPKEIAGDISFDNITHAWLYGDHYKWRAMRANGVDEKYITGYANDWEKFERWAETVPYTLRNPLYHWTHLELQRYFDINAILDSHSAKEVYGKANALLATKDYSTRSLLNKMNVEVVCTTDDPIDDLRFNATVNINRSTYGNYITSDTRFGIPPPGCTLGPLGNLCNFRGHTLNQTPPYTVDLGAQYTFHTAYGTVTPRVDSFISGKVQFLPDNFITSQQKPYTLTNLHLTWISNDEHYKAEAFVNNIENADVISNDGLQSISAGQQLLEPDNFAYYPPRTVGFRFGVTY